MIDPGSVEAGSERGVEFLVSPCAPHGDGCTGAERPSSASPVLGLATGPLRRRDEPGANRLQLLGQTLRLCPLCHASPIRDGIGEQAISRDMALFVFAQPLVDPPALLGVSQLD